VIALPVFPQKSKADKLYAKAEYFRAIPAYKKSIQSSDVTTKRESLIRLGDCYRILTEYSKAADSYQAAIVLGNVPVETYYDYGMVLKSLQRYPEALNSLKLYIQAKPNDDKAKNALRSCEEITRLQSKPQEYTLKNIESINTKGSEFCAYAIGNTLIYTGEKQADMVEYAKNDLNGQPYLSLLYATQDKDAYGKSKPYSKKANTSYHDGPASFSADGNTMYLTRVNYERKADKNFVNYARLYTLVKTNNSWGNPVAFSYNSDAYSCAHAVVSADGTMMVFTSDMPGGFGGKDLWMCKKNGDSWDKPMNLGAGINTTGDEMFPYIRKDGILFFSSNGLPGYGGLDLFSAKWNNTSWLLKRNEGLNLNSSADDFGVSFTSDSTGYVSSNREGGKGKDDIYAFHYANKYTNIEGTVLLTKNMDDPAKQVKVFLLNAALQRIDSTKTDDKGNFIFNDLDADKVYLAELDNEDVAFKNKARYYLADKNGQLVRVTHKQTNGMNFVFRNLPVDVSGIPDLYNNDESDLTIGGTLVIGTNPTIPVANRVITITNTFNDVVEKTTTNQLGAFAFRNLPFGQDYTLSVDGDSLPDGLRLMLTGKNGKEVKMVQTNGKRKYEFTLLAVDKTALEELAVEDSELIMALKGTVYDQSKKPLTNAKITVFEKDKVIQNILTDDKGRFDFRNLGADKNYLFSLDDSEGKFSYVSKIYIGDSKGKIYKEAGRSKNNKFEYSLLDIDKNALGEFSVDDPWLEVLKMKNNGNHAAMTIIENITYVTGGYTIDEAGINILDKVISVLKTDKTLSIELSSHTDSKGSDQSNLLLSQKRAKATGDYLVSRGIAKERLKAIGYGETRLLNNCGNNSNCSEEQHAINRRTEFKILDSQKR
jgi:outer membrane protein OmpA-like peptidoglycan-associated protein/tetratricopeptide (TPR) repeat protein